MKGTKLRSLGPVAITQLCQSLKTDPKTKGDLAFVFRGFLADFPWNIRKMSNENVVRVAKLLVFLSLY